VVVEPGTADLDPSSALPPALSGPGLVATYAPFNLPWLRCRQVKKAVAEGLSRDRDGMVVDWVLVQRRALMIRPLRTKLRSGQALRQFTGRTPLPRGVLAAGIGIPCRASMLSTGSILPRRRRLRWTAISVDFKGAALACQEKLVVGG